MRHDTFKLSSPIVTIEFISKKKSLNITILNLAKPFPNYERY